jgi:hypothetical protein
MYYITFFHPEVGWIVSDSARFFAEGTSSPVDDQTWAWNELAFVGPFSNEAFASELSNVLLDLEIEGIERAASNISVLLDEVAQFPRLYK